MNAFCLSIHAEYHCRHEGACCETWTVPAEPRVIELVAARHVTPGRANGPLFVLSRKSDARNGAMDIARDNNGHCVFFEQDAGRLCVIHKEAGSDALPSACRHFPRTFLRDRRGTFVSLSHFCPTAASLLARSLPLHIVEALPPLMLDEPIEGLDARDALPPLLRPGVLCDLEGYAAWERAAIGVFARSDVTWRQALEWIASATERVRDWRPGTGPLVDHVLVAFAAPGAGRAPSLADHRLLEVIWRLAQRGGSNGRRAIDGFEERSDERVGLAFERYDAAMKNFLAARLFANWIAYQGRGLRSIVHWIRAAAALVRHHALRRTLDSGRATTAEDFTEAIRMTDLLLLHGIDTQNFADAVRPVEEAA